MRGYDAWLTGGDPHAGEAEMVCINPDCARQGQTQVVAAHVEYGVAYPDDTVCDECDGDTLVHPSSPDAATARQR